MINENKFHSPFSWNVSVNYILRIVFAATVELISRTVRCLKIAKSNTAPPNDRFVTSIAVSIVCVLLTCMVAGKVET